MKIVRAEDLTIEYPYLILPSFEFVLIGAFDTSKFKFFAWKDGDLDFSGYLRCYNIYGQMVDYTKYDIIICQFQPILGG